MPLLERPVHSFLFSFDYINQKNKIEIFQTVTEWKSEKLTNSWWKNDLLHIQSIPFLPLGHQSSILIVVETVRMKEFRNRKVKVKNMKKESSSPYRAFHFYPSVVELHCGDLPWPACGRPLPESGKQFCNHLLMISSSQSGFLDNKFVCCIFFLSFKSATW